MSIAESPPTAACIARLARWLALLERSFTTRLILEMSSEKGGWVVWSRKRVYPSSITISLK